MDGPQKATPRWHGADAEQTKLDTTILTQAACRCKAMTTCSTCNRWTGIFEAAAMRRAERLADLLEVAEQRGAVPAGAHLWMPRRGRWRPYQLRDLDYAEALVDRLSVRGLAR